MIVKLTKSNRLRLYRFSDESFEFTHQFTEASFIVSLTGGSLAGALNDVPYTDPNVMVAAYNHKLPNYDGKCIYFDVSFITAMCIGLTYMNKTHWTDSCVEWETSDGDVLVLQIASLHNLQIAVRGPSIQGDNVEIDIPLIDIPDILHEFSRMFLYLKEFHD